MTFVSECTDWYRAIAIRFFFGPALEILYLGEGGCYIGKSVHSTQMMCGLPEFSCVAAVDSGAVLYREASNYSQQCNCV